MGRGLGAGSGSAPPSRRYGGCGGGSAGADGNKRRRDGAGAVGTRGPGAGCTGAALPPVPNAGQRGSRGPESESPPRCRGSCRFFLRFVSKDGIDAVSALLPPPPDMGGVAAAHAEPHPAAAVAVTA